MAARRSSPQGCLFDLMVLPEELVERVLSAVVRQPDALTLRSDALRDALSLAMASKRMWNMVMLEVRRQLPMHPRYTAQGVLLSKEVVKKASVEQLRGWAAAAGLTRAPPKPKRWQQAVVPTVTRLRRMVQFECCSTLPRWMRTICRELAEERRAEVTDTEAKTKWRLSQFDIQDIRRAAGQGPLLLVDVVAKAREKFGGSVAAFTDRRHKVRATKVDAVKARTLEAQEQLARWAQEKLQWSEHAPAFRMYTLYGQGPEPRDIAVQIIRKQRMQRILEALDRELWFDWGQEPEQLAESASTLKDYWHVGWWDATRCSRMGTADEAVSTLRQLISIERRRVLQVQRVMKMAFVPAEAEGQDYVAERLKPYTRPWRYYTWMLDEGELTDTALAKKARAAAAEWQEKKKKKKKRDGPGGLEAKAAGIQKKMEEAGWGMLRPMTAPRQ